MYNCCVFEQLNTDSQSANKSFLIARLKYNIGDEDVMHQVMASSYGIGAVMSHEMPNKTERPIAYTSKTLTSEERNYSQVEKEGLAVVFGIKHFHQYLFGTHFTIITDHKPLLGLIAEDKKIPQMAASKIERWALTLSAYNYTLVYRQGREHQNADCMSRLPHSKPKSTLCENQVMMMSLDRAPVTAEDVKKASLTDRVISQVIEYTLNGWPVETSPEFQVFKTKRNELNCHLGCLQWGTRVIIPEQLRETVLLELHNSHPGICCRP